ncbi:HyaD/HybD family hydrogenase maturation endopeptidase [Microbaculum marinisediminis]|uniref:HyaD/HybD family hydrogenase maturation endopeptidase n=1 Tax=Microbaculum marinisediminis TaxID=2931392 RepID=A0AAW5QZX4_9HYPH|nr:HyaD/HybD family hydrogenase maturation endopeptidase [Microbaculum sp. A6E488]MCT8973472.1 HyaD/HybD family hydrogenase maturation endopeptidase [Microbaculum sp. A6E488]
MRTDATKTRTLVLGIGNVLLSDDGAGVHVVNALGQRQDRGEIGSDVALRDGGTIGLALLSEIEESGALIAVDAMDLDMRPGTVRTFRGADMDAQLRGNKKTAHEVALADLIAAARLAGCAPERRALVAIQPGATGWGLAATGPVQAAVPKACGAVIALIGEWSDAPG